MNEALIFIAIMMATILEGILGALLIVPLLASVIVIMEYLRRRVLGLSPFDADDDKQFVTPPEKIKPRRQLKFSTKDEPKEESKEELKEEANEEPKADP